MSIPLLSMGNMTNGLSAFTGVTLSTNSYSNLLINIDATNSSANVTFHGGNSKYNLSGNVARNALISNGWTITDGGAE